ncbi:MAG: DUF4258 domain-containing protein [Gammaproteobacteria bacterium]|nr:DUF4258 domain-containing protein [Gammaproteobacteria bacterium]
MRPRKTTLSRTEAIKTIRNAADHTALINVSDHAKIKMVDREITMPEMVKVLKNGAIIEGPSSNHIHPNWECTLQGVVQTTGRRIRVIVAIEIGEDGILIVTIFDVKGTRLR